MRATTETDKELRGRFEAQAVDAGLNFTRRQRGADGYRYDFGVEVIGSSQVRRVFVYWSPVRPLDPVTRMSGTACRRHRNRSKDPIRDLSVCLWYPSDPPGEQWSLDGGLRQLRDLATTHAVCEAVCSQGEPWPKREAPAPHARPEGCRACPENWRSCP
jgi:hypothetical protein